MYSEFNLAVDLDKNRRITDLKSAYRVTIVPPADLSISFYDYSQNFFNAAHCIASYLLETEHPHIGQLDSYFFALAFLYRHSIELILKALVFKKIPDKKGRVIFVDNTRHNLATILEELLKLEKNPRPEDEINWLKEYFSDLSKIDKESDSFRYPFQIKRIKKNQFAEVQFSIERVFEKQTHINLILFANKFEAAYEILSYWYMSSSSPANEWKSLTPVFIETGGDYYGQAVVGYGYRRQDYYPYVKAYAETAGYIRSLMKDSFDKDDREKASRLFMPMCYLYRNSIELAVKSAWFEEMREDFQYRCKMLYNKKHSIIALWTRFRDWIKDFYGEEPNEKQYLDDITVACQYLQDFDGEASRFRYPCTKKMDMHFKKETTLDLLNVSEFMESLVHAIDNVETELSVRNEYIDEMEAEYASWL